MTPQQEIDKIIIDQWNGIGGSCEDTLRGVSAILEKYTLVANTDECKRCGQKYNFTPICCTCGIIPLLENKGI